MEKIYRYYSDTEVSEVATRVKCPYCGHEWLEFDKNDCGVTYELECEKDCLEGGCGKTFEMYFDAD